MTELRSREAATPSPSERWESSHRGLEPRAGEQEERERAAEKEEAHPGFRVQALYRSAQR